MSDDVDASLSAEKLDELTESAPQKSAESEFVEAVAQEMAKTEIARAEHVDLASTYLQFGGDEDYVLSSKLAVAETRAYLLDKGFGDSPLARARKSLLQSDATDVQDRFTERYCDFCGKPLTGVDFEHLQDGRDRCKECSDTVLKTKNDYLSLFARTKEEMSLQFGIVIPSDLEMKIISAKRLSRKQGIAWDPSTRFDNRRLAFSTMTRFRKKIVLYVESGLPRTTLVSSFVACLTDAWQMRNWDQSALKSKYGGDYDAVARGMGSWASIQYLYLINESRQADRIGAYLDKQDDEDGKGFRMYKQHYPLSTGIILEGDVPFRHPEEPLPV